MFGKKQTSSRRITVGSFQALLDGKTIPYTLKYGPRCRHARFEVASETGLTAIIPRRYDIKKLPAFFEANKHWILYAIKKYCSRPVETAVHSRENSIPYLGRNIEVVSEQNGDGVHPVRLAAGRLNVSPEISGNGAFAAALESWYRKEASRIIKEKADIISTRMGLSYSRIAIKGMRTRWGSCSVKGNLNFNWRLVMFPEPVIDYVIIHELCHLKEMNHSKKFWSLVACECPDWQEKRHWLTKNGREFSSFLTETSE